MFSRRQKRWPSVLLTSLAVVFTSVFLAACPPDPDPDPTDEDTSTGDLPALPPDVDQFDDAGVPPLCANVDCSGLNSACAAGVCDEATGDCIAENFANGFPCVDGDACTNGDGCVDGVCTGTAIVCGGTPCTPASCDPNTGICEAVALPDGTACDDTSFCTTNSACTGGVCVGQPVDCSVLDSVCGVGTCQPTTGCVEIPFPNDTPCGDATSTCTFPNSCQFGECVADAVDCSATAGPCEIGFCDATTGECRFAPLDEGTSCDDGNACTDIDACDGAGACVGTGPTCEVANQCRVATCDPSVGGCAVDDVPDGTGCDDGDACTTGDVCTAGNCGGSVVDCASFGNPCAQATCDADTGACLVVNINEGGSCDDDPTDCLDETCTAGVCGSVDKNICDACGPSGADRCAAGQCLPRTGDLLVGFDDGAFPKWITTDGDAAFTLTDTVAQDGAFSARSGAIGDGETSSLHLYVTTGYGGIVTFFARVDAEAGATVTDGDRLQLFVDGKVEGTWSGVTPWFNVTHPSVPGVFLDVGLHHLEWRYSKNASGSAGLDAAFIDRIRVIDFGDAIDFEDGTLGPLVTAGAGTFLVDDTQAKYGVRSASVGGIGNGDTASLRFVIDAPFGGVAHAHVRVDADGGDGFQLVIDSVPQGAPLNGVHDWTLRSAFLDPGAHVIEYRYVKDAAGSAGADRMWIDHISFHQASCP